MLPELFVEGFGDWVYYAIGAIETIKGALAFVSCPLVGKVSDKVGRKACLLATVVGTTAPVCFLAFTLDMRAYAVAQGMCVQVRGAFICPYDIFQFLTSLSPLLNALGHRGQRYLASVRALLR